jgi:hypothetical protein
MIRPIDAIGSMVTVAKPGGHVVLVHFVDEGIDQEYSGLHGWNINAEGGHLLLTNRESRIDVNDALASRATVRASVRDGIVTCEIEKRLP